MLVDYMYACTYTARVFSLWKKNKIASNKNCRCPMFHKKMSNSLITLIFVYRSLLKHQSEAVKLSLYQLRCQLQVLFYCNVSILPALVQPSGRGKESQNQMFLISLMHSNFGDRLLRPKLGQRCCLSHIKCTVKNWKEINICHCRDSLNFHHIQMHEEGLDHLLGSSVFRVLPHILPAQFPLFPFFFLFLSFELYF